MHSLRKEFAPRGANSFLYELTPNGKGGVSHCICSKVVFPLSHLISENFILARVSVYLLLLRFIS